MFGLFFRNLDEMYSAAIEQRDAYFLRLKQTETGKVPDWMICAEFIAKSLKEFSKFRHAYTFPELAELIQEGILMNGSITKLDSPAQPEDLDSVKQELGNDAIQGSLLLAEILASNILGKSTTVERRKSSIFLK